MNYTFAISEALYQHNKWRCRQSGHQSVISATTVSVDVATTLVLMLTILTPGAHSQLYVPPHGWCVIIRMLNYDKRLFTAHSTNSPIRTDKQKSIPEDRQGQIIIMDWRCMHPPTKSNNRTLPETGCDAEKFKWHQCWPTATFPLTSQVRK